MGKKKTEVRYIDDPIKFERERSKIHSQSIECMCKTSDDWYPNFTGNMVMVSLTQYADYGRVSIWGADDSGMEKEYEDIRVAASEYSELLSRELITRTLLDSLGFIGA